MTTYSLTMRADHEALLRTHLLRSDGAEYAAYVRQACESAAPFPGKKRSASRVTECTSKRVP